MITGQIVFSPIHANPSDNCQTYFGAVNQGSSPPPEGSGSITVFDYMQNQYTAHYSPTSLSIQTGMECTYNFGGPKMNSVSSDGLYKMVLDTAKGPSCPADDPTRSCFEGYWVTASAIGVLAFADTSSSPCPAFFAVADDGSSQESGSFTIAGVALMRETSWVPQGYAGSYNAAQGSITINTPGCLVSYKLDPGLPPATLSFASGPAPGQPGSATLEYVGVSSASCPTECASKGYNVAWDATGLWPEYAEQ